MDDDELDPTDWGPVYPTELPIAAYAPEPPGPITPPRSRWGSLRRHTGGKMTLEALRDADLALTPDSEAKARLGQPSPADAEVLRQLDELMDQQERDRSKRWTVPLDGDPVYRARIFTTLSLAAEGLGLTKSGGSMWPNEWGQIVSENMGYIQATRRARLWGVPLPTFMIPARDRS